MKKQLLILFFLSITFVGHSQNSWIQKLYLQDLSPYNLNNDSLTGIRDITIGADGDVYVIANFGKSNSQKIFKIDPSGAPIKWSAIAGNHGGLSSTYTYKLQATTDSGCIIAHTQYSQSMNLRNDGIVRKYASDGTLQWEQYFQGFAACPQFDNSCYDVSEIGNNFYAAVGDSIVKFDHSGNVLSYDSTMIMPMRLMPNNDMIVTSPSLGLARLDQSGNVIWSNSTTGNCGCPASYYYDFTPGSNTVSRIDLRDGSTVWSKSYPWIVTDLDSTADGGFVASFGNPPGYLTSSCNCAGPGTIFRSDVNGDTLWSNTYDFPYYGLSSIKVLPSGNIITGGGFIFARFMYITCTRDYSSFVTMLDSSGHGILETTDVIWPGDANTNQVVDFTDDALNVTIAWGSNGLARDTIDQDGDLGATSFQYFPGTWSDIASDWPGVFASGINHKHADFNGDGVIDMGDILPYSVIQGPNLPLTIPNWRLANPESFTASISDFNLFPEQDTVLPGTQIKYFLTLGNSNIPVDSIYGLTFIFDCNYNLLNDTPFVSYSACDMGVPGNNLMGYDFNSFQVSNGREVLISRIDHNNVYQLHDTIAEITMTAKPNISSLQTLTMNVSNINALTFHESPVQFNVLSEPVVIDPNHVVGIESPAGEIVEVFPNPSNNEFTIHDARFKIATAAIVSLYNVMGEVVKTIQLPEMDQSISVSDLPDGFYMGKISSEKKTNSFSFIIQH